MPKAHEITNEGRLEAVSHKFHTVNACLNIIVDELTQIEDTIREMREAVAKHDKKFGRA